MNIEFSERTLEKISEVSPESCEDFKLTLENILSEHFLLKVATKHTEKN